jgi:hypothetical protein
LYLDTFQVAGHRAECYMHPHQQNTFDY